MSLICSKCDKYYKKPSNKSISLDSEQKMCAECFREMCSSSNEKCQIYSQKSTKKGEIKQDNSKLVLSSNKLNVESNYNEINYDLKEGTSHRSTSTTLQRTYDAEDLRVYRTVCFSYIIKRNMLINRAVKSVKKKVKTKIVPQPQIIKEEILKVLEVETVREEKELISVVEYNEYNLFYFFVYHFFNNFIHVAEESNPIFYHLKSLFRILLIAIFFVMTVYYKIVLRIFIFISIINLYYRGLHQENIKECLSDTIIIW